MKISQLAGVALLLVGLAGCAAGVDLDPAASVEESSEIPGAVVRETSGARMVVQPDTWTGDAGVLRDVTPVQLTIRNGSDKPVAVRYQNFALVSPDGEHYSAVPPFQVEGSVDAYEMTTDYGTIGNNGFGYDGFGVSPYYGSVYDGIGVASSYGFGVADYGYYGTYGNYWNDLEQELPTREMVRRALPEGVVEPGGRVTGFLYFEKVKADEVPRVSFRADLQNPEDGRTFGKISIPFTVSEEQ